MNTRLFQLATVMMWLALPLTALNYRRNWDRLPARMAVHFDINWQPNGWTSPGMSLRLALGITAFLLMVFTIAIFAISRARVSTSVTWIMLALFYLALGFVYFINAWVVERNLQQPRVAAPAQTVVFRDLDSHRECSQYAEILKLDW